MLHWSGNFDEFQDFEFDIRQHFGGQGLMEDSSVESATPLENLSVEKKWFRRPCRVAEQVEPPMSLAVNPLALATPQ